MKVGYYGYDNVFRSLFPPIIKEAEEVRGHEKGVWLPPQVRGVAAERKREVFSCDVLLLGLSSFQTQEELELVDMAKKVVVIADVPGSELRPKAQMWVQEQAAFLRTQRTLRGLIIALKSSRQRAFGFGYRPEDIHYLGPPPHWGVSYRQMLSCGADLAYTRSGITVRYWNQERRLVSGDYLVFVPGGKNPLLTNTLLRHSIVAGKELLGERFLLGFAPHPGERAEKPEDEEMFARAFAERDILLKGLRRADMSPFTNPERYAIADLVITTGGPTETVSASYARNTNIMYYRDEAVTKLLAESGVQDGKWFVPDYGGAHLVGPGNFLAGMRFAMSAEGKEYLRIKQEENFPLPETWDTATAIVS